MPTTQVEFHHGYEPQNGVLNFWHWKEGFRVRHEAARIGVSSPHIEIVRVVTL